MTKLKSVKEVKLATVEPTPEPEVSLEEIKTRGDNDSFKIAVKPEDSPKVKKAKLIAIFAADKAQNPERYARKNKDAELERRLKVL